MTKSLWQKIPVLFALVAVTTVLGALQMGNAPVQQTPGTAAKEQVDTSGVIFFDKDLVAQSFAKSTMIYDGVPQGRNHRVSTLRRDKPGEVEVHAQDTDIVYVLDGSATFVTGGSVVGGRSTGPGETRGSSMQGGTSRTVSKGDIFIVPSQVAHWFKEIQQPITYLTVKVR